ncbi:MAG: hypothetical protein JW894_00495 [Bacteroidales bacterium]|nr:hypothetical protein [Bacteroidales bacterium]
MRLLKKTAIWVIVLIYMIIVFGFMSNRYNGQLCNSIEINIYDSVNTGFLSKEDIIELLESKGIQYLGIQLSEINLDLLEEKVKENQIVEVCESYLGINGTLNLDIIQRKPFIRIIDQKGLGYYFDQKGNVISLSPRFTPHVLVVNGHINTPFTVGKAVNIFNIDESRGQKQLKDIFILSKYIAGHELWKSQFVQIYVNKSGEFELIPRVGPHIILLGNIENFEQKLDKLETFYEDGLNTIGWNQYLTINLKYRDQVVCTKI